MDTLWTPYGHPMDTLWTPMDTLVGERLQNYNVSERPHPHTHGEIGPIYFYPLLKLERFTFI
jgi:hypothetical protein